MASDNIWDVIRNPRVTEKGTLLGEQSKYVFEVAPGANKIEIKAAVEQAWPNVKVTAVNVLTVPGKRKRWRRHTSLQPDWKKAIVTLESGQRIEFLES